MLLSFTEVLPEIQLLSSCLIIRHKLSAVNMQRFYCAIIATTALKVVIMYYQHCY